MLLLKSPPEKTVIEQSTHPAQPQWCFCKTVVLRSWAFPWETHTVCSQPEKAQNGLKSNWAIAPATHFSLYTLTHRGAHHEQQPPRATQQQYPPTFERSREQVKSTWYVLHMFPLLDPLQKIYKYPVLNSREVKLQKQRTSCPYPSENKVPPHVSNFCIHLHKHRILTLVLTFYTFWPPLAPESTPKYPLLALFLPSCF